VTANALHWNLAEKKKETEPLRVRSLIPRR
jgi:hypothetical protein